MNRAPHQGSKSIGTVVVEMAGLLTLSTEELAQIWQRQIGKSMPLKLPRSLLARSLAYRLQVERHGELPQAAIRMLEKLADDFEEGRAVDVPSVQIKGLKPGTVLVREHGKVLHRVMVLAEGYAWNGKTYPSLSNVAKAISGTNWNGNVFFGLKAKGAKRKELSVENLA